MSNVPPGYTIDHTIGHTKEPQVHTATQELHCYSTAYMRGPAP